MPANNPKKVFANNDNDRAKVQNTIRLAESFARELDKTRAGIGSPPCMFGRITNEWTFPENTVTVQPVYFDDLADIDHLDPLTVYVTFHDLPINLESQLAQNNIVPYTPFQGVDVNDVGGIIAGDYIYPDQSAFGDRYFNVTIAEVAIPYVGINPGYVYFGDTAPVAVSMPGSTVGYPVNTTVFLYVEIVVTPVENAAPTIAIDDEIQEAATAPAEWTVTAGVLTINWIIGEINSAIDAVYQRKQHGDIHLLYPYQPFFHANIQGGDMTEAKILGHEDGTTSVDGLDDYFLEERVTTVRVEGGGWRLVTDNATPLKFGGKTVDNNFDYVNDAETDVENQVTLIRKNIAAKFQAGLCEEFTGSLSPDVILSALGKWVGIEVGGKWKHLNSPVDSTSHPDHWFYVTFPVTSIDGVGASSITLYFDKKGHLWQYNTTTQPPPDENYLYRHCSDPSTYPDIIFAASQGTTVIEADGECYKYVGLTEATATAPVPTVGDTYATCALCEGSENMQWIECDSPFDDVAVLTPAHTTVDYAWLCVGGVWVKAKADANTFDAATDPSVLEQCGEPSPASCLDLPGWPAFDNFIGNGSDCNTVAKDDTNYGVRWTDSGLGTIDIVGGDLECVSDEATHSWTGPVMTVPSQAGDFEFKADWSANPTSVGNLTGSGLGLNSLQFYMMPVINPGDAPANEKILIQHNGSQVGYFDTYATSGELKIERIAGIIYYKLDDVTIYSAASAVGITSAQPFSYCSSVGTNDVTALFENFTAKGAAGADILIDPSGEACV